MNNINIFLISIVLIIIIYYFSSTLTLKYNKINPVLNKKNNIKPLSNHKKYVHIIKINKSPCYNNIYHLTPYQSTTLSLNYKKPNYLNYYPQNIKQKPWYNQWTNNKNQFLCFLDPHLNRKCIWTCPNKNIQY